MSNLLESAKTAKGKYLTEQMGKFQTGQSLRHRVEHRHSCWDGAQNKALIPYRLESADNTSSQASSPAYTSVPLTGFTLRLHLELTSSKRLLCYLGLGICPNALSSSLGEKNHCQVSVSPPSVPPAEFKGTESRIVSDLFTLYPQ